MRIHMFQQTDSIYCDNRNMLSKLIVYEDTIDIFMKYYDNDIREQLITKDFQKMQTRQTN